MAFLDGQVTPVVSEELYYPVEIRAVLGSCFSYVVNPIGREFWDYSRNGSEEISDGADALDLREIDLGTLVVHLFPASKPVVEVLRLRRLPQLFVFGGKV